MLQALYESDDAVKAWRAAWRAAGRPTGLGWRPAPADERSRRTDFARDMAQSVFRPLRSPSAFGKVRR
jgi:hypothetical protein